jgi:HAMP domain-containing protein
VDTGSDLGASPDDAPRAADAPPRVAGSGRGAVDGNGRGTGTATARRWNGDGNGDGRGNGRGAPGKARTARAPDGLTADEADALLGGLEALYAGDFSVRLDAGSSRMGKLAGAFNRLAMLRARMTDELVRVSRTVGREGNMTERASLGDVSGGWAEGVAAINSLVADLARPTTEVARVLTAVAEGDLSQKMALDLGGRAVQGEFLRIGTTVNRMVDQLNSFSGEVTRVAREVGTEGQLGGQANVPGVAGTWKDLTDSVNAMAGSLTTQVRNIADVTKAVAAGDLSRKITVDAKGEMLELKNTINTMVDQLSGFASEVTRVAREVGTEGVLGGQAHVPGVAGTWKDLTDNVNALASNLTGQVRTSPVTTASANGDLSQKITVDARASAELKTPSTMVDQLNASPRSRAWRRRWARGRLGGQAQVRASRHVEGPHRQREPCRQPHGQVRNVRVATAVARGDLSRKITVGRARRDPQSRTHQHDGGPLARSRRGDPRGARRWAPKGASADRRR